MNQHTMKVLPQQIVKHTLFAILFLCSVSLAQAQSSLVESANEFATLSMNGEAKEMVDYFHPLIIDEIGNKRKVRKMIEENTESLAEQGVEFLSHEIGKPFNERTIDGVDYALVPQYIIMNNNGSKFKVESYLLAINEGSQWKFINTGNYPLEKIESFFPSLQGELTIPEKNFENIN